MIRYAIGLALIVLVVTVALNVLTPPNSCMYTQLGTQVGVEAPPDDPSCAEAPSR